jgi:hypothetical protein
MQHDGAVERRHSWNAGLRERFRQLEDRWNRAHPAIGIDGDQSELFADDPDGWASLGIPVRERHTCATRRPNVLIIGSGPGVGRVLLRLERSCSRPLVAAAASPLRLPTDGVGTLFVLNAEHLTPIDQQHLYAWLTCAKPKPQVFTTTTVPLFASVVRGTFIDALFYRLNEVCVIVRDGSHRPTCRKQPASAAPARFMPETV